jgi:hypothetical protein
VRLDNIINLKDHFADLGGKLELLLLRVETFIDSLGLHVAGSISEAVNTEVRVVVLLLLSLDVSKVFNTREARVFCKGDGGLVEGIGKGSDGVLVSGRDLKKENY